MRNFYYVVVAMLLSCGLLASCTKLNSYRDFMCTCKIKDEEGNIRTSEYGVQESSRINALPLCSDIEDRIETQNREEGIKDIVSCNLK